MGKPNKEQKSMEERRQYVRVEKNFILTYFDPGKPRDIHEITQLKNISLGGMCFVTSKKIAPGTVLGIDLNTPYVSDTTYVEGKVLQSHEKVSGIIYETRFQYADLSPEAEFVLKKLITYFTSGDHDKDE
jgi:c-di-GMP-binding flagellar brake protein YcgR